MKVDIGKYGRDYAALRSSGYRVDDLAIFLKNTCLQPLPD
jgi:hypothetical protein